MSTDDRCTYKGCNKPESDPVHPAPDERMGGGRHVFRVEATKAELRARRAIAAALDPLTPEQRARVVKWIGFKRLFDEREPS